MHPDFKKSFIIQININNYGVGAVLLQKHQNLLKPVSYTSCSLNQAEKNYLVTEKNALSSYLALPSSGHIYSETKYIYRATISL